MTGRSPKPTQLKMLQGTYRPDRANPGEIFPDAPNDLSPPEWLSERAQEKWNEIAPILGSNGLLTECDLDTLALLLRHVRELERSRRSHPARGEHHYRAERIQAGLALLHDGEERTDRS